MDSSLSGSAENPSRIWDACAGFVSIGGETSGTLLKGESLLSLFGEAGLVMSMASEALGSLFGMSSQIFGAWDVKGDSSLFGRSLEVVCDYNVILYRRGLRWWAMLRRGDDD